MKNREEKLKERLLGKLTHNLGVVVEKEDRILCYVSEEKIGGVTCASEPNGILNDLATWTQFIPKTKYIEKYNLKKPIYFIYRNIDFYDKVNFSCPIEEYNFVFENCRFEKSITIEQTKNVTFKNNYYYITSLYIDVENLRIIEEGIVSLKNSINKIAIDLKVKKLYFKDSIICLNNKDGGISIKANEIEIIDSYIDAYKEIEIYTDKLFLNNSDINSKTKITLNDKSNYNNMVYGLESPRIIYNGINLSALNSIEDNNLNKQELRKILLEQLKALKSNIEQTNIKQIIQLNKRR